MQEKREHYSDISERILQMIESLDVNVNQFARNLGYNRSQAIYDMINGKSKPSFDFFNKLLNSEYSEKVDVVYLISGTKSTKQKKDLSTGTVPDTSAPLYEKSDYSIYKDLLKGKDEEIAKLNREIGRLQHAVEHLKKGGTVAGFGVEVRTELDE